jgi:hypothetical protein
MGLVGPEAEQRMVAQLDSSLNEWVDSVPDHRICSRMFIYDTWVMRVHSPLGPSACGHHISTSIRRALVSILPAANCQELLLSLLHGRLPPTGHPSTICLAFRTQPRSDGFHISRNLHERGTLVQPRHRGAPTPQEQPRTCADCVSLH